MASQTQATISGRSSRLGNDGYRNIPGSGPPLIGFTLLVSVPSEGFKDPGRLDNPTRLLLDQIESQHHVSILTDEFGVTIRGSTKPAVAVAMKQVYEAFRRRAGNSRLWHPKVLIDPRCWLGHGNDQIGLDISTDGETGARPVVCPDSALVETDELAAPEDEILAPYQETFRSKFDGIFENLRYHSTEMRMRVVYGTFRIEEWKKNKHRYSCAEFEKTMQKTSLRGTCHMEKLMGNDESAARLLDAIFRSPGQFYPVEARIEHLKDVAPVHYLIIALPGYEVEVEILSIRSARGSAAQSWQLGPLRGYRCARRNQQITIITSSPQLSASLIYIELGLYMLTDANSPLDWSLEVKSRDSEDRLPFSHAELAENVKIKAQDDKAGFPQIDLAPEFSSAHRVEAILGKTTSVFNMQGSPYNIAIAVYRRWGTTTMTPPVIGAGVEVYAEHWDDIMRQEELAGRPRNWEADLSGFFPYDYSLDKAHLDAFFYHVRKTQDWLCENQEL